MLAWQSLYAHWWLFTNITVAAHQEKSLCNFSFTEIHIGNYFSKINLFKESILKFIFSYCEKSALTYAVVNVLKQTDLEGYGSINIIVRSLIGLLYELAKHFLSHPNTFSIGLLHYALETSIGDSPPLFWADWVGLIKLLFWTIRSTELLFLQGKFILKIISKIQYYNL